MVTNTAREPRIWRWMLILSSIVIGLCIVYALAISCLIPDVGERGQIGDSFGALNALFAGFAFGGLIIALHLQRLEIKQQWKELELTRKEIAGQTQQLKNQARTLEKQNFENSYFQLLRFHIDIVNSMETFGHGRSYTGRGCFDYFKTFIKEEYNPKRSNDVEDVWRKFSAKYERHVNHYFRHLYNTVQFVDQHALFQDPEEKRYYTNLVRGQLSRNELWLLFYNCLNDTDGKFKCLVEKFSMLEGMDPNGLLDPKHKDRYADIAYGTINS